MLVQGAALGGEGRRAVRVELDHWLGLMLEQAVLVLLVAGLQSVLPLLLRSLDL